MNKRIEFHKAFMPAAVISAVVIVFGVIGFFARGINFGLDYRPGLIEEVSMSPTVMSVTYDGSANVAINLGTAQTDIVISGVGATNETRVFNYAEYDTVGKLAAGLAEIDNISVEVDAEYSDVSAESLFVSSNVSNRLGGTPFAIYANGLIDANIDDVRAALSTIEGISVQQLGSDNDKRFQVRVVSNGDDDNQIAEEKIISALAEKYGEENIAVISNDFIGSSFSKSIAWQSFVLLASTLLLIWIYSAFRFHWDFALGAIVALIHDSAIMITFIVWSQMEFSTMTVAAILTIVGYSINATIVILDRVRDLLPTMKSASFTDIIDQALTDTLSRSIITTATTLFAVVALFLFTSGGIKNFAGALIVGLLSGCYSSILISSCFVALTRKNWKPEYGIHHSLKANASVPAEFGTN